MRRSPVAAGRFYPADPKALADEVSRCLQRTADCTPQAVLAAVAPHAGYVYSGRVAGETLARIRIPESVLLLGPNHTGRGYACALSPDDWQIPGAEIPRETALCAAILRHCRFVQEDSEAHRHEHSLEVLLPFLHALQPRLRMAALCLGGMSLENCQELAAGLHQALTEYGQPVLVLASTDMNHYESREVCQRKDRAALDRVLALDAPGLFTVVRQNRISMCGVLPVTTTLFLARLLGAQSAELVRHTDSGEFSGDTAQVVGYAGLLIS